MKIKKLVSALSALTIAAGAFAGLAVTASAEETTVPQTLTGHTEIWGASKENPADCENQIYLNSYAGQGGAAEIYFKLDDSFDATKVTAATLSIYATKKADRKRSGTINFYGLSNATTNQGNLQATYAGGAVNVYTYGNTTSTKRYAYSGTPIATFNASSYAAVPPAQDTYTDIDLTSYIKSLTDAKGGDSVYIGMSISDFAFDSYFSGYGNENPPKLSITYSSEEQADYTIRYIDSYGTTVKEEDIRTGVVGSPITLTDADKAIVYANDNKYVYASDDSAGATIKADGSTVVTVTFNTAGKYEYTVNYNGVDKAADVYNIFDGDAQNVYYPRYVQVGTDLYEAEQQSSAPYYGKYVTEAGELNLSYAKEYENVEYFIDCDESTSNSVAQNNMASGGAVRDNAVWSTTLDKGTYRIIAYVCNRDRGSTIAVGGEPIANVADVAASQGYGTIDKTFTVTEDGTTVELTRGELAYDPIDTVVITAVNSVTADAARGMEFTDNASDNGDASVWTATITNNTVFNLNTVSAKATPVEGDAQESESETFETEIAPGSSVYLAVVVNKAFNDLESVTVTLK